MKGFEKEYQQNIKTVFAFIMADTGDHHLSEELTQETFYRAYRSINNFRGDCKVSVWLCQIAKHCLLDYRKKETRHVSVADVKPSLNSPSAETIFEKHEESKRLYAAISTLPSQYKNVLMLHYFAQISLKDIADIFDKSESWARVTCFRAKEKLRKTYEGVYR